MGGALAHRGPDDEGVWSEPAHGLALVQRRLAIIDLSPAGRQPMVSRCGRYVIVFNGECYNFEEVRRELIPDLALRGRSDTEVVLESFAARGLETTLARMAGMFALALWDRRERTLSLVRDRLGKKPLYYGVFGGTLLFASELKALHRIAKGPLELDQAALSLFLRLGYIPAPWSVYKAVKKLAAGQHVTFRAPAATEAPSAYWTVADAERRGRMASPPAGDAEALAELDALLRRCVRERMISDVPLGAFLSGGIDSSLVVALMQAQSERPVRTFSISFREAEFDEGPHARLVAQHLGTDHTELLVTSRDALDTIPSLAEIYDEPFADASQIPTCLLSRLTRQHVTVSLSGDGGDELFLGYAHYAQAAARIERIDSIPFPLRRLVGGAIGALPERMLDTACRLAGRVFTSLASGRIRLRAHYVQKYANAMRQPSRAGIYLASIADWFDPSAVLEAGPGSAPDPFAGLGLPADAGTLETLGLCDLALYIPEDILVKVDRASMAWSLESRAPLLDHRVVEFALGLPRAFKRRDGVGKWLLRELLYRYVPRPLVDRPKQGFAVPMAGWMGGPLREWTEEMLSPQSLQRAGVLDVAAVRNKWTEHLAGRHDWSRLLWPAAVLQSWLQRWKAA